MKRAVALVAAGSAVVLAAGCSGESAGQPEPDPTSSASSSATPPSTDGSVGDSDLPHSGAPEVSNPLPESVLSGDPCEALTRSQLEWALGSAVPGERRDIDMLGPRCSWDDDGGGFTLTFLTATRQGLSIIYSNNQDGGRRTLTEVEPVHDLPTITLSEERIACSAAVGLADEYAVLVNVTLGPGKDTDACDSALRLSDMVVGNLKDKA
ncbi:DUF3558 domain-containing protein [Prauserella halophila]|uniref:DUF3558 domain-containing protein n=1 Tax=Prauserella halophila TaxID=185641 RepID=A0ABN1WIE6_9PSEU|nr:DUF3558 domain-containing protein [Prauserella halophila]MCP2236624.1 Protein of unknown function (DUF3558) [Prauserella halophila]